MNSRQIWRPEPVTPLPLRPASDAGLYATSVAAELTGLHPQTLRDYERRGLLEPARTDGGTRRYSDDDVARLHHIGELTDAGVSIEGVRRILLLEAELAAVTAELDRARRAAPASGKGSRSR
jgi:MerR family transcriptional regulator/heat shock protein HspR